MSGWNAFAAIIGALACAISVGSYILKPSPFVGGLAVFNGLMCIVNCAFIGDGK